MSFHVPRHHTCTPAGRIVRWFSNLWELLAPLMICANDLFTHVYASLGSANCVAEVFELPRYYLSLIGTLQKGTTPWSFGQTSCMSVCIVPQLSVTLRE